MNDNARSIQQNNTYKIYLFVSTNQTIICFSFDFFFSFLKSDKKKSKIQFTLCARLNNSLYVDLRTCNETKEFFNKCKTAYDSVEAAAIGQRPTWEIG